MTTTAIPDNTAGTQAVSSLEIRFTNPTGWIEEVKADLAACHVQDNIIRLATRKGPAQINDLEPERPWDKRLAPQWRCHYVEAAYVSTRQQLVKLSCFAGVAMEPWADGREHSETVTAVNEQTRRELLRTMRKVQSAIARVDGLDIRGGGLFVEEGVWLASPGTAIEAPEALTCEVCACAIYWSNEAWRHQDDAFHPEERVRVTAGRAEAYVVDVCPDCKGDHRKPDPHQRGAFIICRTCRTSPGERTKFHHSAAPASEEVPA